MAGRFFGARSLRAAPRSAADVEPAAVDERFDIRRNPRDHLGFGGGLHACLGAALARLEARVAMEELLTLVGEFEVSEDRLERMYSPNVRGYTRVPIRFAPK